MIKPFAMFPVLVATELNQLKAFYEMHFGFKSEFFQQDFYLHLLHPESNIQMAFMVPDHPSQPDFLHPLAGTTGMVISLEVENAQQAYDEAKEAGLTMILDFKVEEFGVTHFMVEDPAGFIIDIVEHHDQ